MFIQEKMIQQEPLGWPRWLKEADQYMNAMAPEGKSSKFGTDIRYNLLSMSLESYIMAICDFHNYLPDNHTYTDLVIGLERILPLDENLKSRILKYENIQSICSIEKYHRDNQPQEQDLADLKNAVMEIGHMAHAACLEKAKLH